MKLEPVASAPVPSNTSKDARYFSFTETELPSKMAYYNFDILHARPYELAEMFKLGAASKSRKLRYVVEAVNAVIDQDVFGLLMCDFMYLCYWLRVSSYKRRPFSLEWGCENLEHRLQVLDGADDGKGGRIEVSPDTLRNVTLLEKSDIHIRGLDIENLKAPVERLYELGVTVWPQTVATFLEADELANSDEVPSDEDVFLYPYACILGTVHGKSIRQRLVFLRSLTQSKPDDAMEVFELLNDVKDKLMDSTVHETMKARCNHCGKEQEVKPNVDLLSFFPFGD